MSSTKNGRLSAYRAARRFGGQCSGRSQQQAGESDSCTLELSHATLRKMYHKSVVGRRIQRHRLPLGCRRLLSLPTQPEIAALAMSGSSVLVAINALIMKRTTLPGTTCYGSVQSFSGRGTQAAA
jgi:hypothetical protein